MNPAPLLMPDHMTWSGLWLTLLAIAVGIGVHILATITRNSWRETGRRLDEGVAKALDDPIRTWQEDPPVYDQDLDGTDLEQWDQEMTS